MRELEGVMAPGAVEMDGFDAPMAPFMIMVDGVPTMFRQSGGLMLGRMARDDSDCHIGITMSIESGGVGDGMVHFMNPTEARALGESLLKVANDEEGGS